MKVRFLRSTFNFNKALSSDFIIAFLFVNFPIKIILTNTETHGNANPSRLYVMPKLRLVF